MQFLIKSAVNNLTSHNKDLPSQSCISSMNLEATQVSKQQITDVLCGEKKKVTLLPDSTTKKGIHIYGVKLVTETETFIASLPEISPATVMNLFETTKDITDSV